LPIDDYLREFNPNIIKDRELRRRFRQKTLTILYPGISLDNIEPLNLYAYDYVIGIDFVGRFIKCDYVFTQELHILSDLMTVYPHDRIIATDYIYDRLQNKYAYLPDLTDKVIIIETTPDGNVLANHSPYFLHADPLVSISHLLVSSMPKLIQLLGADFTWRNGRSHVNNEYYNNGYLRNEDEAAREENKAILKYLSNVGRLAKDLGVTLMRNSHV
jgi:hypothetical protein